MHRPLGTDFRRRRYWAFGNRAACWRIFVESHEGGAWGWYEGAGLIALLQWLRAAPIEIEQPLLRALEAMPIPKKHTQGGWTGVGAWCWSSCSLVDVTCAAAWLKAGRGSAHKSLLHTSLTCCCAAPLPPYPLPLPLPPAGMPPVIPWTPEDLAARRPDGYKLLAAPLLKVEKAN